MTVGLRAPGQILRKRDSLSGPYQTCLSLWLFWKHSWGVWFYVSIAAMIDCNHSPQFFRNVLINLRLWHESSSFCCTDCSSQMRIGQRVSCVLHPWELPVIFVLVACCCCVWHRCTAVLNVAQATCAYTLPKDCGLIRPGPPPNVVWVIGCQCVLGAFTPVLGAVYLWSDHSGCMLMPSQGQRHHLPNS